MRDVNASKSVFLSDSHSRFLIRSGAASFRFLPTSTSSRLAVLAEASSRRTNARMPTRASTTTKGTMTMRFIVRHLVLSSWVSARPGRSIAHQDPFLEQIRRQLDARRLQPRHERRPHPRRLELAEGPAVLVDPQLLEAENVLHNNHVAFHA